jgi:para-aminobenzoate synthetase component 1
MGRQEVEIRLSPTALLARCAHEPYAFVFDGGSDRSWGSGHALLGYAPKAVFAMRPNGQATVRDGTATEVWCGEPFELFDRFRACFAPPATAGLSRWAGGVVAALSYDLAESTAGARLRRPADEAALVLHAAVYDWVLVQSYARRRWCLASTVLSPTALRQTARRLEALAQGAVPYVAAGAALPVVSSLDRASYVAAVRAALEYIAAGDIYQVNLAQRFTAPFRMPPPALFGALQSHPMPFAAYVDAGEAVLVSNSPECLLLREGESVLTCPIKGTRARARHPGRDRTVTAELQADAKEAAEHVMIVDLERNDLGRVCRPGSVQVREFARVVSFPSLHHLVSEVAGTLRGGVSLGEVLRALFPGGSITGAPKIRAMEVIEELEPVPRGFYTGAIGFVGWDDYAVFNIAIRTAIVGHDAVSYHAGGGIVADSIANREYEETLLKAQPFLTALRTKAA